MRRQAGQGHRAAVADRRGLQVREEPVQRRLEHHSERLGAVVTIESVVARTPFVLAEGVRHGEVPEVAAGAGGRLAQARAGAHHEGVVAGGTLPEDAVVADVVGDHVPEAVLAVYRPADELGVLQQEADQADGGAVPRLEVVALVVPVLMSRCAAPVGHHLPGRRPQEVAHQAFRLRRRQHPGGHHQVGGDGSLAEPDRLLEGVAEDAALAVGGARGVGIGVGEEDLGRAPGQVLPAGDEGAVAQMRRAHDEAVVLARVVRGHAGHGRVHTGCAGCGQGVQAGAHGRLGLRAPAGQGQLLAGHRQPGVDARLYWRPRWQRRHRRRADGGEVGEKEHCRQKKMGSHCSGSLPPRTANPFRACAWHDIAQCPPWPRRRTPGNSRDRPTIEGAGERDEVAGAVARGP